jgi:MFS transporter, SHS family, lactate transporter
MATLAVPADALPWWKEPIKEQWYACAAAGLGWTLDAFDFTIDLLIMR